MPGSDKPPGTSGSSQPSSKTATAGVIVLVLALTILAIKLFEKK